MKTPYFKFEIIITYICGLFQFNGVDLFYWIDQGGNNRTVKELINGNSHVCDDKAPIIREDSLEITNKDYLPLKAQYIY